VVAQQVEEVFVRVGPISELRVAGQVIQTTPEHPFYVRGKGWRPVKELYVGDQLSSHDGQWIKLDAVVENVGVATVYNLRVSAYHTYFVGCQEWGFSVWAHNDPCGLGSALAVLGHDIPQTQLRPILAAAMKGDANVETVVFRLRKALMDRQIFLNAEQESKVFSAALKGTPLESADLTPHLVSPTPAGRALTPEDSPLLKRYLEESGGRWGGTGVRQLNHRLASELEAEGWTVTGGAGRFSEEFIRGPKGVAWVDITATKGTQTVRIQTVTTLADGITLEASEVAKAAKIRAAFPNDKLILVSKQTGKVLP
jgi:hypothetical protein